MTVKELMQKLSEYPEDLQVWLETGEGFEELRFRAEVGIPDYYEEKILTQGNEGEFFLQLYEESLLDPEDEEVFLSIQEIYQEELTPKLILTI